MRQQVVIEFTATLVVKEDGDEYEGGELTLEDARGWVAHVLSRGDKHASNFTAYGASPTSVTYEESEDEE
ncbi:hypothetical protein [Streptomyces sp. ITFR-6]|uniref:hypothetical protein n=1 Tax=Streptomyces sp. ITFR-6 TaxID=3075197 RepID=UPI0028897D51|nr:hypothetical protein [Streptomyces sp. ITFR-6]WNI28615.1 hypothetical protein RLT59_07315 [Streptomyces sp. ITFR-6]